MKNVNEVLRHISQDFAQQFEQQLRSELRKHSKAWLIEEIVRYSMPAHVLAALEHMADTEEARQRNARIERLHELALDSRVLRKFLTQHKNYDRPKLIATKHLQKNAPEQGTDFLEAQHRLPKGEDLLERAKDMLYGLLFGGENTNTKFVRGQREMLVVTLPKAKTKSLNFMQAATRHTALGTWQDPESVSNDVQAENVLLEVEFGEIEGEWVGQGIALCLQLINLLEVNEQILYVRMMNVEQSSLVS